MTYCLVNIIPPPLTFYTNLICHFVEFSFFSYPPPPVLNFFSPLWEFSTLLLTINPSSSQSCYAAVPGEICEHQAMLIHHQFSERLRNYIFFLPSKYWVSHLFVRLGGQARTRGKQPPKVYPRPQDTLECIAYLGIIYFKTSFLWTSKLPTSKLWSQEILQQRPLMNIEELKWSFIAKLESLPKRIVLPIIVATMVGDRWRDLGHWLLNRAPPAWTQVISHQSSSQFPRTRIRRCFFKTFSNHTPGTADCRQICRTFNLKCLCIPHWPCVCWNE